MYTPYLMTMTTQYDPGLVSLSLLVAILASYVALDLSNSITKATGRHKYIWLFCGAIAMGFGIWSMHFVGMLAFHMPGMVMAYDVPLIILSVVIAIAASAVALNAVTHAVVKASSFIFGGIFLALAIAGMHYVGMFSMRMNANIIWQPYLVFASVVIAFAA